MTVNQLCLILYRRHVATQKEDVPTKIKEKGSAWQKNGNIILFSARNLNLVNEEKPASFLDKLIEAKATK